MKSPGLKALSLLTAAIFLLAPTAALAGGAAKAPAKRISRSAESASPASAPASRVASVATSRAKIFGLSGTALNTAIFVGLTAGLVTTVLVTDEDESTDTTSTSSSHH